jgi:RNA-splicing ligase RtcB
MRLKGKYADAVVFTEDVEPEAVSQIVNILDQPMMKGVKVRIMPDVHAGAGICIGYTATMNEYVVPNFIGVDIGCGLCSLPLPEWFGLDLRFDILDKVVRGNIPSGFSVCDTVNETDLEAVYTSLPAYLKKPVVGVMTFGTFKRRLEEKCKDLGIDFNRALLAIGTLGGGNHFISVNRFNDNFYLVVHSGSRNFGKCVADYHQTKTGSFWKQPDKIGYLEGAEAEDYFRDMAFSQLYAAFNRRVILHRITGLCSCPYDEADLIESVHNYINFEDRIIRKGAVSAQKDEKVLIPLSMADGILFGYGRGNQEWNCSAPHGAGRLMSRSKAKQNISLDDYKKRMDEAGVWSSCVSEATLDESPQAYKDPAMIVETVKDTVDVRERWHEIYNFKAS